MGTLTLNDFSRFAIAHDHGRMFVVKDQESQSSSLGRHIIRSTTGKENYDVRALLFTAISRSGYLDGQKAVLDGIRLKLGLNMGNEVGNKPLEVREVRALVSEVRLAGRNTLSQLLDEGFTGTDVQLLRAWLPPKEQQSYVDEFKRLRENRGNTDKLILELRQKLGEIRLSEQMRACVGNNDAVGLAAFVVQKCYNVSKPPAALNQEMVVAFVQRRLADAGATSALRACPPGKTAAEAIRQFVKLCADEVVALARQVDAFNDRLWQDANRQTAAMIEKLPADRHLTGMTDVSILYRDCIELVDAYLADPDYNVNVELDSLMKDVSARFDMGVRHLLAVSPHPQGEQTREEIRVRARGFAEEAFGKYFQPDVEKLGLPEFDETKWREHICGTAVDLEMDDWGKGDFSLAHRLPGMDRGLKFAAVTACDKLHSLVRRRSATDTFVAGMLAAELGTAGLDGCSDEELSAVRSTYERLYAREVVSDCDSPGWLTDGALDQAVERMVKKAVDGLRTARELMVGLKCQIQGMQRVVDFKASSEVTDQMREAFDEYVAGLVSHGCALLTEDGGDSSFEVVSKKVLADAERKIDELQTARRRHLRAHVTEAYQKIREDFDKKIVRVESELAKFEETLEPLDGKIGLELLPGLTPKPQFTAIHEIWVAACDKLRERYETEPRDFDPKKPELSKFNESAFLRQCRKELAEAWRARSESYAGAIKEVEQFLRDSGMPSGLGLTMKTLEVPVDDSVPRELVLTTAVAIKDLAFNGDDALVRRAVDELKQACTRNIADHNREMFMARGGVESTTTSVKATRAYLDLAIDKIRTKASFLMPKDGFTASLFEEGFRNLRSMYAKDTAHYHTEQELAENMRQVYDQAMGLWEQLAHRIHQRIVDRAEPQFYGITDKDASRGGFRPNFEIVINDDVKLELAQLIMAEQRQLLSSPTTYNVEEAMANRIDVAVDHVIEKMMMPTGEQRLRIQEELVDEAVDELARYSNELVLSMTKKRPFHRRCPEDVLRASAIQYASICRAEALKPVPAPDDGVIHAHSYRPPEIKELKAGLKAKLEEVARLWRT